VQAAPISIAIGAQIGEFSGVQATRATIIRLTKLTDSSLIVHWFSEEHGLVKTVAKGARRSKGPYAGKLDLFFSGEIVYQRARRGELHALREVAIDEWRGGLRRNYTATLFAGYCCMLLEKAVEPEHPEPALHDLLGRALDHVDAAGPSLRALRHFEREVVKLLGVSNRQRPAEHSLREVLHELPAGRVELVERLSTGEDLGSSGG